MLTTSDGVVEVLAALPGSPPTLLWLRRTAVVIERLLAANTVDSVHKGRDVEVKLSQAITSANVDVDIGNGKSRIFGASRGPELEGARVQHDCDGNGTLAVSYDRPLLRIPARLYARSTWCWMQSLKAIHNSDSPTPGFDAPRSSSNLKFVHIAKTGGSSVEAGGKSAGLKWGRNDPAFKLPQHKLGLGLPRLCRSAWHEPFHLSVGWRPNGVQTFCVARDPVERFVSEFNYRAKLENGRRKPVAAGYSLRPAAARPSGPEGCPLPADLNRWASAAIVQLKRSRYAYDCHLLPTAEFVSGCSFVVPYDRGLDTLQKFLRHTFNISALTFQLLNQGFGSKHSAKRARRRCAMAATDLSPAIRQQLQGFYAEDVGIFHRAKRRFDLAGHL